MTRFLKLVRHEDGKWKALPTDTDDLTAVSIKERKRAPIDPQQLLKALVSLLSTDGGIKSIEDVPRLASLMKKFSKKLVSRCVYCNVLQATEPSILSEYLDKGGWETINTWLQYAKSSPSPSFLIQMLELCKLLPMTLTRLKENNNAKLIKSLTKHENSDVKNLSTELVTKWMSIIKGKKAVETPPVEKKKKKEKEKHKAADEKKEEKEKKPADEKKEEKEKKPAEEQKATPKSSSDTPKSPVKLKGQKRPSGEKENKKEEFYEDVKIDPEPLLPAPKKLRPDRPKTAKIFQKKFRATGLEEETPLPKNIAKKASTVDKTAAVAAAKNALKLNSVLPDRINEKKIKQDSLLAINESPTSNKGIKLIPAKPRPTYQLHESASFMDALISQPVAPVKRKKKGPPNKPGNSPTSPTLTPPKLQFYKDTLEMNDEKPTKEESEEKENIESEANESSPKKENETSPPVTLDEEQAMEIAEEDGGHTPPNPETVDIPSEPAYSEEAKDPVSEDQNINPNELRSILSHGRRRGKKKTVKWVEDDNIKEIFYFELDETERVNVLKTQNFGDLKSIDSRKEREAIELAKRQTGDKMEEMTRWWMIPILIDLPPTGIDSGCLSKEREIERVRQQTTLQEIYFTREMIPDSPHEPDLEIIPPQEPRAIPLEEITGNNPIMDYSNYELPKPALLPDVLKSLINIPISNPDIPIPQHLQNNMQEEVPMDTHMNVPLMNSEGMNSHPVPMPMTAPYDPAEPLPPMAPNSLLGHAPPMQNMYGMSSPPTMAEPQQPHNMAPQSEWRTLDMVQDQYYGNYPGNSNNHNRLPEPNHGMNMRPRMMHDNNYRPNMHKGHQRGPRPRNFHRVVPCRHFLAGGCRFDMKCSFLHPGVNGPPL